MPLMVAEAPVQCAALRATAVLLLLFAACADDAAGPRTPSSPAPQRPDRDRWWTGATERGSGKERLLAPRELRALLAEGRAWGFDGDAMWWGPRSVWAYERILVLDPDDVEANEGVGRTTLQSLPGFEELWPRLEEARVADEAVTELLDRFGPDVRDGRPIFLFRDEVEPVKARMREAAAHLDRLASDPSYAAEQRVLAFVRSSHHGDYPYLHVRRGPFLVFYAARDLQTIPGEDEESERKRVADRRDTYLRRLDQWLGVYEELLADVAQLYPDFAKRHPVAPDAVFPQWIFQERAWYADVRDRLRTEAEEPPYRRGFHHRRSGWAYLVEPTEAGDAPDDPAGLKETAAYLAATQLLWHWGHDPEDPLLNRMERSEDVWFKEGWPSFLAARRLKDPAVGRGLRLARDDRWRFAELIRVVERRNRERAEAFLYYEDPENPMRLPDGGYTDLAWLLVRVLHGDEHKAGFVRFLSGQVDGTGRGIDFFEECFGIRGGAGWRDLERAVYGARD